MQTGIHNRGFASMDRERQREIARKGGKAAHEKGTAHEFTAEEAQAAGRKGGERVSADRAPHVADWPPGRTARRRAPNDPFFAGRGRRRKLPRFRREAHY